jgi:hypothetical protein
MLRMGALRATYHGGKMDEIGRSYLALALNLDRHLDGFVDAYFGPPQLRAGIEAGEPRPLRALADDVRQLQAAIEASGYDLQRRDYLARQARAMAAVIRTLSGQPLDFLQEVELYFDIEAKMIDEAVFESAHAEMDRLLPGGGSLHERMTAWKKGMELEAERILPMAELARLETRRRSLALFDLPPHEGVALHVVENQPWSAYNWYLGDYRSRIELNTDLPIHADAAVHLLAHEAYPGHHTEHAAKEYHLYRQQGRPEHAVQLILAPECVLSEGIGDSAKDVIFDDEELADFLRTELYPLAGLPDVDVERQIRLSRAEEGLRGVSGNAALLLHRDSRPPAEVQDYLEHFALRTPEEAEHTLKFIQNPLFRSYIFTYAVGKELLAPLLQGPDRIDNFRRLLSEPFTPTQVRRWSIQATASQG